MGVHEISENCSKAGSEFIPSPSCHEMVRMVCVLIWPRIRDVKNHCNNQTGIP